MQLFLEAVDVWLFRDGRPFDALSDHRAESLFPPYPSVVQGVIRSHHLVVKNVDLRDAQQIAATVGTTDDYKTLRLRGPFLAKKERMDKSSAIFLFRPMLCRARTVTVALVPIEPSCDSEDQRANTACCCGPRANRERRLRSVATGRSTCACSWSGHELSNWSRQSLVMTCFERESRMGIARNDARRTTEEGALYEVEFIRPCKDVGPAG